MAKESVFQCPVCSKALKQGDKQYFCQKGHSYDIARKGYVNLLLPNHKGAGDPGDSKEMIQSRRDFLQKGFFEEFSNELNNVLIKDMPTLHSSNKINILDSGCGEGYYILRLKNSISAFYSAEKTDYYGIDVSKPAIHYASGRDNSIRFAVASTYHVPILTSSVDYILCIFAPRDEEEFYRVLKPSGKLIVAAPGSRHLYGLRAELYGNPELIGQKGTVEHGFKLLKQRSVAYTIHLNSNTDILNLLMMTPYSRHTELQVLENIKKLNELSTEVDINIMIYQKV